METLIKTPSDEAIKEAANIIIGGGLVAIPTETVYGLGANALDEKAVARIFKVKGRPQDNPLIIHVNSIQMAERYVKSMPNLGKVLAKKFWPGPLTMVLPKEDIVPSITSGGLNTVGIRIPANPVTLKLIDYAKTPIAAPSANISGLPSPTTSQHVFDDINGKIPLILDGGKCTVGVESTVISFEGEKIKILRPGGITPEELEIFSPVIIDKSVGNPVVDETPPSPGMKYKHYSPKAEIILLDGNSGKINNYLFQNGETGDIAIIHTRENPPQIPFWVYGNTGKEQAENIFHLLRLADKEGYKRVFIQVPKTSGIGLAVYNRLIRAANFNIKKL